MSDEEKGDNWASSEELAAAIKSGEIDPSTLIPPGLNRKERRAFAAKRDIPVPKPDPKPAPMLGATSTLMTTEWEKIEKEILPPETSADKRKWAKRLFMAGAMTLLSKLINEDVLDESDENSITPQDVNRVDAIWHELNAFFSQIAELQ